MIVRTALRFAVARAITSRTMAGALVRDSSIDTLEDALSAKPAPIVLIYTEDCEAKPTGRELWTNGWVDITMLVAVAGAFTVNVEDDDGGTREVKEFRFPTTDESSELSLDVIERQIKTALLDPGNPWGEIWKKLVVSVEMWSSKRGSSNQQGNKFAARQIVARVNVVDDPVPGRPPTGVWAEMLALLDAEADMGTVPALLRALIDGKAIPADFRDAMQQGLTWKQARAIGLGRVDFVQDGAPLSTSGYRFDDLQPGRPEGEQ